MWVSPHGRSNMIQLYIANKNYSSWSMRPWVLLRQAGIDFEEVYVRFDSFAPDSQFKATLKDINPVGKVPRVTEKLASGCASL